MHSIHRGLILAFVALAACQAAPPAMIAPTIQPTIQRVNQPTMPPPIKLPRVFVLNPEILATTKTKIAQGDPAYAPALQQLVADANARMNFKVIPVTAKSITPDSGDKHDYVSLGPYWWPDPNKPGGVPYIQRDGERNPQAELIADKATMQDLNSYSKTLALAYYFTGDEKYAQKLTEWLRVFYLDPATRMHPHGNFAQVRVGHGMPNGTGIIDFTGYGYLIDAVGLLAGSKAWIESDQQAMQKWCGDFLDWMLTSAPGKNEAKAINNHGSWYDAQVAAFALFAGKDDLAKKFVEGAKTNRIAEQIEPDGKQSEELKRTLSLHYSAYNLRALARLAALGDRVGIDLWNYQTSDGRSLRKAIDFITPALAGEQKWTYAQISPLNTDEVFPLLLWASVKYNEPRYRQVAIQIAPVNVASAEENLTITLFGNDPVAVAKPTPAPTASSIATTITNTIPALPAALTTLPAPTKAPPSKTLPADAIIIHAIDAKQKDAGVEIIETDGAANGHALTNAVGAKAVYAIELPHAGNWYVWLRLFCPRESADSYWIGIDNTEPNPPDNAMGERGARIYSAPEDSVNTPAQPFNLWFWDANAAHTQSHVFFKVSAPGKQTLWVKGREAGTLLDQILLTQDVNFDAEQFSKGAPIKK